MTAVSDKKAKELLDEFKTQEYAKGFSTGYKVGSNYRELGCQGCVFESKGGWKTPCVVCMRSYKDYYRRGEII